jgi:Tol biopolymer transport system component
MMILRRLLQLYGVLVVLTVVAQVGGRLNRAAVAFQRLQNRDIEIHLLDLQTGVVHNVTPNTAGIDRFPTWSPDGNELVVQRDTDRASLYRLSLREPQNAVDVLPPWMTGIMPSWSPDGCCLAFSAYTPDTYANTIHMLRWSDGRIWNAVPIAGVNQLFPVWSPDAKTVGFVASGVGMVAEQDLYTTRLTTPPRVDAKREKLVGHIRLERLTEIGNVTQPAWLASQGQILFTQISTVRDDNLFQVSITGDDTQPFPIDPIRVEFPDVSPDGAWVVFSALDMADPSVRVLYRVRTDGNALQQLTFPPFAMGDTAPRWRPYSDIRAAASRP